MNQLCIETGGDNFWRPIGWMACVVSLLLLAFYTVISGWFAHYASSMLRGDFAAIDVHYASVAFERVLQDVPAALSWHSAVVVVVTLVVAAGVRRGLASVALLLVPLFIVGLLVMLAYVQRYGDVSAALQFLFSFNFNDLTSTGWLVALGQAFFSLGIGMGAMMVFGGYLPDRHSIANTVLLVALLDAAIAVLAGIVVYALVLGRPIEPSSGPALLLISVPYSLSNMVSGDFAGVLFFVVMAGMIFTSAVALAEPSTAWLVERFKLRRPLAAAITGIIVWLLGAALLVSLAEQESDIAEGKWSLFVAVDMLVNHVLLPLSGFFIAVFVGWIMPKRFCRDELHSENDHFFWLWRVLLRYIAPPAMLVIMASSLYFRLYG